VDAEDIITCTQHLLQSSNDLLDSRAPDSRRMGIDKGRENTTAFNQFVIEANSKFNNTIPESIEHAIQSSGDINGEKTLENNSDDEYHPPITNQKRHQESEPSNAKDDSSVTSRSKRKRTSTVWYSTYVYE